MPARRLALFHAEIARARDLVGLGQRIEGVTFGVVDGSDLYRAALVHAVAALDTYVHGVVLDRGVDILLGRLPGPSSNTRIGLHFGAVQELVTALSPSDCEL